MFTNNYNLTYVGDIKNITYDTEGKVPVVIKKHQTMLKRVPAIFASNTTRSEQLKSCYSYFNHVE